jgi:hypothetical protein
MIRYLLIFFFILFLQACADSIVGKNNKKNLESLDKTYGVCNNPMRNYSKIEKKICLDKERAAGPDGVIGDPINLGEVLDRIQGKQSIVYAGLSVNPHLWNSSLGVLEPFSLKIVDSQGGFISTDWILKKETPNERCMVKVNVTSQDLVSNGVKVKLICEKFSDGQWYVDNNNYLQEEKDLTIKILEVANELSKIDQLS